MLCLWEGCDAERQTKENFKSLNTLGAQKANTAPVPGTRLWPPRNNFTPAQRKVRSYAPPGPSVLCGKGQPRGTQTTLSSAGARPPGAAPGGKAPARSLAARRCTVQGAAGGHSRRGGPFPPPHLSGTWVAALRVTWSPPSSPVLRVVGDLRTSFAAPAELQPVLGEMLSSCGARLRALRALCRDASAPARSPRPALAKMSSPTETERCIESLIAVFQRYAGRDGNRSSLSKTEFLTFMNTELAAFTKNQKDPGVLDRMMKKLDTNRDGQLDFQEFLNLIGGLAVACHDSFTRTQK